MNPFNRRVTRKDIGKISKIKPTSEQSSKLGPEGHPLREDINMTRQHEMVKEEQHVPKKAEHKRLMIAPEPHRGVSTIKFAPTQ